MYELHALVDVYDSQFHTSKIIFFLLRTRIWSTSKNEFFWEGGVEAMGCLKFIQSKIFTILLR